MMMSQPIQPSSTGITGFGGSQGFIQGRQRLQQTPPPAGNTSTASQPENVVTQRNQALLNSPISPSTVQQPEALTTGGTFTPTRSTGSGLAYQEIQSIAEKAGYVGVTQRDIDRAYRLNKSLLVDYKA